MKTRIIKTRLWTDGAVAWVPQYKSAWYMPWRRITDEDGELPYTTGSPGSLVAMCEAVANGERPPVYPKEFIYKEFGE